MTSPFDDRFGYDRNVPARPERALTNQSPKRFAPTSFTPNPFETFPLENNNNNNTLNPTNGSPSRFSPSVAFGRRHTEDAPPGEMYHTPMSSPNKMHHQFHASPSRLDVTPRKLWSQMESPKRQNQNTVIVIDDSDDENAGDDASEGTSSYYGIQRSATRGSNSTSRSSRILPPPKPIFSATTYAAANHSVMDSVPSLQYDRTPSGSTMYSETDTERGFSHNEKDFSEKSDTASTLYSHEVYDKAEGPSELSDGGEEEDSENEFDAAMMHEVPAEAQPRRHRSTIRKKVSTENGNLVLENPVPTKLASFLPRRDEDEFLFMRYSACTAEPDEFEQQGFTLRAAKLNREIEICVCITMYNESEVDLTRTMHNVMKNVAHLCSRNKSRVWGPEGWKKVQVVIVSDGRMKINANSLDVLAAMGVYQEGIAKSFVNSKAVKAHLFEYTTQVSLDSNLEFKSAEKGIVPVQVLFCLKEENKKKINSHRWLFNAFCPVLDPKVVVLLDVGTKPNDTALYHFWKTFDRDSNVAGAAGEIKAIKGKGWNKLLNPIVASQNFEYKMSNILDKPLESAFGYISVLPGALSAYRYKALRNNEDGTGPLCSYFKGEELQGPNRDVFSANMYLAEDRILCWELVAKKNDKWLLRYVKDAQGETDLPETVSEFISQRRRWLNGALFAAIYSQLHFRQIWKTNHSRGRKVALHIEFFYQFVQLLFSWFSIANFYLTFYFLAGSLNNKEIISNNGGFWLFTIFNYICIATLASMFIVSMGNRPQGATHLFITAMVLLSLCSTYSLICGLYFVFRTLNSSSSSESSFVNIVVSLLSTYGLYVFMSIIYLDPWHILTCSLQYFLLLPSYTCTLQIFAFCNTHDVSWGTKGDNNPTKSLGTAIIKKDSAGHEVVEVEMPSDQMDIDSAYRSTLNNISVQRLKNKNPEKVEKSEIPDEDYYRDIRTRVVLTWLVSNLILVMIVSEIYSPEDTANNKYLAFILWSVAVLAAFRSLGSLSYLFMRYLRSTLEAKHKLEDGGKMNFSITKWFKKDE